MRTKPRYKNEEEILTEIDRTKERAVHYLELAEQLESEIAETVKKMNKARDFSLIEKVNYDRKEVRRLRRISASLIDSRLVNLKNKLEIIRTPQLAAIDNGDASIPVTS